MTQIVRTMTIESPPAEVFEVLSHVERLPELSSMTSSVNGPGRPLAPGDRFDQTISFMGIELDSEWEVTEVQPSSRIAVAGRSATNAHATLVHRLEPSGSGTELEMTVEYDLPLGILGDVVDRLVVERTAEHEAERILGRLKDVCERTSRR